MHVNNIVSAAAGSLWLPVSSSRCDTAEERKQITAPYFCFDLLAKFTDCAESPPMHADS